MINYCSVSFYKNLSKKLQKLDRPRAVCRRIAKDCDLKNYKDIYEEKLMFNKRKVAIAIVYKKFSAQFSCGTIIM